AGLEIKRRFRSYLAQRATADCEPPCDPLGRHQRFPNAGSRMRYYDAGDQSFPAITGQRASPRHMKRRKGLLVLAEEVSIGRDFCGEWVTIGHCVLAAFPIVSGLEV